MAERYDHEIQDEFGNIYLPHSNSKTNVYSGDKTKVTTTSEALDEIYNDLEFKEDIVTLTLEEYNALSEKEKLDGTVYMIEDAEIMGDNTKYATETTGGLMAPSYVKKLNELYPKVILTLTTTDEELFGTEIHCGISGQESVIGTFDDSGVCKLSLLSLGTYLIKTSDGGTVTFNAGNAGEYKLGVSALPRTVINITTTTLSENAIIIVGPENNMGIFDSNGVYIFAVRTTGTYVMVSGNYTEKIVVDELGINLEVPFN